MLVSPEFLFVIERGRPDPKHPREIVLDGYSKAQRLSYLLWNSTPDDDLLKAAERGELDTRAGLEKQQSLLQVEITRKDKQRRRRILFPQTPNQGDYVAEDQGIRIYEHALIPHELRELQTLLRGQNRLDHKLRRTECLRHTPLQIKTRQKSKYLHE